MAIKEILGRLMGRGYDSEEMHVVPQALAEELRDMTDVYDSRVRHRRDELLKYSIMIRVVH